MSSTDYKKHYLKVISKVYDILEDWNEDMSELSDRDKHLIDACIRASWNHKNES